MKKENYLRPEARCFALMTECGLMAGSGGSEELPITTDDTTYPDPANPTSGSSTGSSELPITTDNP